MAGDNTAYVRGVSRANFAEGEGGFMQVTPGGEQLAVIGLPLEAEVARQGTGYVTVGSAVAPVAAIPTTAAHLSLYNNNGAGGKSLIIAAVGTVCTTSMAVQGQATLLARNDVPFANTNPAGTLIITGLDGRLYNGGANAKASVTLAAIGAANNVAWVPVATSPAAVSVTTIGLNVHNECWGRWIVRPGGVFSLATVAQTAAGSFQPYIYFYEVQLPLP